MQKTYSCHKLVPGSRSFLSWRQLSHLAAAEGSGPVNTDPDLYAALQLYRWKPTDIWSWFYSSDNVGSITLFPPLRCSLEIQEVALEETQKETECAFAWLVQGTSYVAVAQMYPTYRLHNGWLQTYRQHFSSLSLVHMKCEAFCWIYYYYFFPLFRSISHATEVRTSLYSFHLAHQSPSGIPDTACGKKRTAIDCHHPTSTEEPRRAIWVVAVRVSHHPGVTPPRSTCGKPSGQGRSLDVPNAWVLQTPPSIREDQQCCCRRQGQCCHGSSPATTAICPSSLSLCIVPTDAPWRIWSHFIYHGAALHQALWWC